MVLCSKFYCYVCQPFFITDKYGRRQSVPCGKCLECLQEKKQEWCFRLDVEKRFCDSSFFVTLTYEDNELTYADDEPCLCKRDVQLFFKRLRKALKGDKIKYYCVGEYGDQWRPITPKGRPHYHALIFYRGKLDWFKLKLLIKDTWPFGICQVLPVLGAQGYVTKYILKFDKREHLVKPFSLISHGLGIDYLTDAKITYHRKNLLNYCLKPGGYKVKMPRYYQDKVFNEYERLIIKKRCDQDRLLHDRNTLLKFDAMLNLGINPWRLQDVNYQDRVYNALKIYKMKKRL